MRWIKSRSFWGAVIVGAAHTAVAFGKITAEQAAAVESFGGIVFGIGIRSAIAKNGAGK